MLVQEIMTRQVIAIDSDMPIKDVYALMEQRNIRHFPIVKPSSSTGEKTRLVGIVSDRDIRMVGSDHPNAKRSITLKDPVKEIMVYPVLIAHPLDPIEEAAQTLCDNKIGAMPVLDNDELVGIVTGIDFLGALVRMSGVSDAAARLEVEVDNQPDALVKLLNHIAYHNITVLSVMPSRKDNDVTAFALRVNTINPRALAESLRNEHYNVLWPQPKATQP